MRVYLAGPIFGTTDSEATTWRSIVRESCPGIEFLDPMDRDYRGREDANVSAIVEGDKQDILSANTVVVGAWRPSWGTAMEVEFAYSHRIPVIAIVGLDHGPVSPWLRYHARIVESMTEAVSIIKEAA